MVKVLSDLAREQVYAEEDALIDFQFALIDAMRERGMTKAELAVTLGVSRARVSQLFSSSANPTLKLAARALFAVGLKNHYCPCVQVEADDVLDLGDFEVGALLNAATVAESTSIWLGEFVTSSILEPVDDTKRWFACQHRSESTGWHRRTRSIANSNGRKNVEAA